MSNQENNNREMNGFNTSDSNNENGRVAFLHEFERNENATSQGQQGTGYIPPQNRYQPYYQAGNSFGMIQTQVVPPKKKRGASMKVKMAAFLAVCLVLSAGAGFGGNLLAQGLHTQETQPMQDSAHIDLQPTGTQTNANIGNDMTVAQIANAAANSVVEITTESVTTNNFMQQYISEGAGSGVIISKDGYIITNNHVIEGSSKITVRLKNGKTYSATLIGTDKKTDIAVLKVKAADLQPAVYGNSDTLQVGELAVAIGNPLGQLGGTVTDGIISALDRSITMDGAVMNLLQTNAAINPGNSGGGLFNGKGELVGIVNAKSSGSGVEGLGFAIPVNTAKTVAKELMQYGYVRGRVDLGISVVDISNAQMAMMYRVNQLGVYVSEVTSGSDSKKAGLRAGDRIAAADGTTIDSSADLTALLDAHSVGDQLTLTIVRDGQKKTIRVTLSEYVPSTISGSHGSF